MNYETFIKTLKENDLTLKKFSELSGSKYSTCSKWGKDNRPVSDWVDSWFRLYIENKNCKELQKMIKDSGLCG
jgi:hypothetical protein